MMNETTNGVHSHQAAAEVDPRRCHPIWGFVNGHHRDLCEGLGNLASVWGRVEVRDELELAVAVTDIWRRVDALLGEYQCAVWFTLLELGDIEPRVHRQAAVRELSPSASMVVVTAMAAARAVAARGVDAAWDCGEPAVRRRLDEIRDALRRITLGEPIPDVLAPSGPAGQGVVAEGVATR